MSFKLNAMLIMRCVFCVHGARDEIQAAPRAQKALVARAVQDDVRRHRRAIQDEQNFVARLRAGQRYDQIAMSALARGLSFTAVQTWRGARSWDTQKAYANAQAVL